MVRLSGCGQVGWLWSGWVVVVRLSGCRQVEWLSSG